MLSQALSPRFLYSKARPQILNPLHCSLTLTANHIYECHLPLHTDLTFTDGPPKVDAGHIDRNNSSPLWLTSTDFQGFDDCQDNELRSAVCGIGRELEDTRLLITSRSQPGLWAPVICSIYAVSLHKLCTEKPLSQGEWMRIAPGNNLLHIGHCTDVFPELSFNRCSMSCKLHSTCITHSTISKGQLCTRHWVAIFYPL
jgi:hypothetical protein